jgi:hypothetical protein
MKLMKIIALLLALAGPLAACNHHGQTLHQDRPGGNDTQTVK